MTPKTALQIAIEALQEISCLTGVAAVKASNALNEIRALTEKSCATCGGKPWMGYDPNGVWVTVCPDCQPEPERRGGWRRVGYYDLKWAIERLEDDGYRSRALDNLFAALVQREYDDRKIESFNHEPDPQGQPVRNDTARLVNPADRLHDEIDTPPAEGCCPDCDEPLQMVGHDGYCRNDDCPAIDRDESEDPAPVDGEGGPYKAGDVLVIGPYDDGGVRSPRFLDTTPAELNSRDAAVARAAHAQGFAAGEKAATAFEQRLKLNTGKLDPAPASCGEGEPPSPGFWPGDLPGGVGGVTDHEEVGPIGAGTPHARMQWFWERMDRHRGRIEELTGHSLMSGTYRFEAAIADAFDKLAARPQPASPDLVAAAREALEHMENERPNDGNSAVVKNLAAALENTPQPVSGDGEAPGPPIRVSMAKINSAVAEVCDVVREETIAQFAACPPLERIADAISDANTEDRDAGNG